MCRKEADSFVRAGTAGTPEQIAESLAAYENAGLGYAIIYFPEAAYDTTGMAAFERAVLPDLRG